MHPGFKTHQLDTNATPLFEVSKIDIEQALASFYPRSCAFAMEEVPEASLEMLHRDEEFHVRHAVIGRRKEFAAGRIAAHRAIGELGGPSQPIGVSSDRSPVWPLGYKGSISHTASFAVAVAGRAADIDSVGVDIEESEVPESDWAFVFSDSEIAFLKALPVRLRVSDALIMFSAKETFFKLQYPKTHLWLDFLDVEVSLDKGGRAFAIACNRPLMAFRKERRYVGSYMKYDRFCLTGMYLPHEASVSSSTAKLKYSI